VTDARYRFHSHAQAVTAARTLPELKSMPRADFVNWLADNPKMYRAFRAFALDAVAKKRTRFSAYMIRERVRWYTNIEYGGRFKISNNVTPYIARLLALDVPILDKVFAKKEIDLEDFGPYTEPFPFEPRP
jgi:hypothetical protein